MKPIKQPVSPRAQENELADVLEFMVSAISTRFENGVLKALNAGTVDKFADAQVGNYAAVTVKLAASVKRKIMKQFNNKRIQAMIDDKLRKVDKQAQAKLYAAVEQSIGISTKQLMLKEAMQSTLNAQILETSIWVQKLRDESLTTFTNNTLFAMSEGKGLPELLEQFKGMIEERKGHAKFLARNTVQNFNAITTKARVQRLGIKKAVWDTALDDSVRPSHADRDGKEFDLSEGLYSSVDGKYLIPGIDFNCRCVARYIVEDDEPETEET